MDALQATENGMMPQAMFNTTLFSQTGLSNGQHQLMIHNDYSGSTPAVFDLDYVLVTTGDGNAK